MKKIIILVFVFAAIVLCTIYFLNRELVLKQNYLANQKPIIIGFSMGTTREERWFKDRDFFVQRAQELGATINVSLSDYDVEKQILQIENMISQGASVIVVIPADSEKIWPAIEKAKEAGVKVIAYDRLIKNTDIDLYISFDNVKIGELQAESILAVINHGNFAYIGGSPNDNNATLLKQGTMNILNPLIKNGSIKLVVDSFTEDWKPDLAYKTIEKYLDSGSSLDAVVAANDGTAFGAIRELQERGLAGKIPVSGQDAELSAAQRIVAGTQTSTVYKPINALASKAAEMAVDMASGQSVSTNSTIDNGKDLVPSYYLLPIIVNKDNMMDTIIKDGFHTYEEVYALTSNK